MITLGALLALPGADLTAVAELVHAETDHREPVTGYQRLADLDVIDAADGIRIYLRGESVVLVYLGETALPPGLDDAALTDAVGSTGELLPSRQGKRATLHVVADHGLAWSEADGEIGFVEVFPPSTPETYRNDIYLEPPTFVQ